MATDDRLVRDQMLTPSDFRALATARGVVPMRARKSAPIAARLATAEERIETHWNGQETTNTAKPGDWIATSLTRDRQPMRDATGLTNTYVIAADRFGDLYQATGAATPFGEVFVPKSTVLAIRLSGGFDIMAPWGERQTGGSGYLLLNGNEVYGNQTDTFEAGYDIER